MKRDKLYTVNKWNRKLWDGGVIPIDNYIEGDTLNFQARMSNTKEMLNNKTIDPISIKGINDANGINDTSNIGDVVGMASTALGIVGTAKQNAQIDNTAVNRIEDTIEENNNATASASSFDTLEDQWALWTPQESISWRDIRGGNAGSALNSAFSAASSGASIGSTLGPIGGAIGGIFGGLASGIGSLVGRRRAKKKAAELNRKIKEANFHRINTFNQNAENLDIQQDKIAALNFFSEGGKIHIKPENRGKFTALKKRTGKSATWFKEHGTPSQKKMATFALNARKWKHANGGFLDNNTHGGIFSNGVIKVDEGGSHESNPNEGIQMGIDSEGIPNLVEEGEVIFNNYVFSNRLIVPKEIRRKLKLGNNKSLTYAEAAKRVSKESEERPNDPLSKNGLTIGLGKLASEQEKQRNISNMKKTKNKYAVGGIMDGNFTYTPVTGAYKGGRMPEVTVTAKRVPRKIPNIPFIDYSIPNNVDSNLPILSLLNKESIAPISYINTKISSNKGSMPIKGLGELNVSPLYYDEESLPEQYPVDIPRKGAPLSNSGNSNVSSSPSKKRGVTDIDSSILRYAPVIGSGMQLLAGNSPEYENANIIRDAANSLGRVKSSPVGNYLTYKPLDRSYYLNKLAAHSAASRRAIRDTSGGNRAVAMAGILASDYNTQKNIGDFYRQAEEYNASQRVRVQGFYRQTDMFNSEAALKADMANLGQDRARLEAMMASAKMKEDIKRATEAARSANLTNFFDNLGNIGWEEYNRNMLNTDPSKYYSIDDRGRINYKKMKSKGGRLLTR